MTAILATRIRVSLASMLAIGSLLGLAARGQAGLVLSLDARQGASSDSWRDLSGTNLPFSAMGNPMLAEGAYVFDGDDHFVGNVEDEGNFDFETAKGGQADPFIAVVYFRHDPVDADVGVSDGSLINKASDLLGPGWMVSTRIGPTGNPDQEEDGAFRSANVIQQPNFGTNRAYSRPSESSVPDADWHLYVFEVDGSGVAPDGHKLYAEGGITDLLDASPFGDALTASVLNDAPLRIGGAIEANGLVGELQFVEIYTGATVDNNLVTGLSASEYSEFRIQNLDKIVGFDPCDYNRDGVLDLTDLNLLRDEVKAGTDAPKFDVNGDGRVDTDDIVEYVESPEKLNTYVGDANFDLEFNSGDLITVSSAGEYEDGISMNSIWQTGDWDGNGDFESDDLVLALSRGGYELGPRVAVNGVPEPSSVAMLIVAGLSWMGVRRRRRETGRDIKGELSRC